MESSSSSGSLESALPAGGGATTAHDSRGGLVTLWCVMTVVTASAAIFTRYCKIPASSIGFWRVFGAAVVLFPWWIATYRRLRPGSPVSRGAILTGVFLGVHFATWAWALLHATVANAAVFVAMQPAVTPLIGHWLARDRLGTREYVGTALACAGMLWIVGGQVMFTRDQIPGSMVALFSMICCAVYVVLGRRYRARGGQTHLILFSVPVYLAAAATQAIAALAMDGRIAGGSSTASWWAIIGLILLPTVGGHTLAMYLVKHLKAHTIVLSIPLQFVLIAIMGVFFFGEWPKTWFYPGAAIVLGGVILAVLASRNGNREPTKV